MKKRTKLLGLDRTGEEKIVQLSLPLLAKADIIDDMMPFTLPAWLSNRTFPARVTDPREMLDLAIELAEDNVREGSGGPFGAVVFDGQGNFLGWGVNLVASSGTSIAHAEMVALAHAQIRAGVARLPLAWEACLAASAQPCSMCYGALPWSGIGHLWIAATREDVETLTGFDEGPLPSDWKGELQRRGIAVEIARERNRALQVLRDYRLGGGKLY